MRFHPYNACETAPPPTLATHRFVQHWVPVLGPVLASIVLFLRSRASAAPGDGPGTWGLAEVAYEEIARATGLSRRTVIRALRPALKGPKTHPLRTFVHARATYRLAPSGAAARSANTYLVRMDDPVPETASGVPGSAGQARPTQQRPARSPVSFPSPGATLSPGDGWPIASRHGRNGFPACSVNPALHDDPRDNIREPGDQDLLSFLVSAGMAEDVARANIRLHGREKVLEAVATIGRLEASGRIRNFPAALHSFLNYPGRWCIRPGDLPAMGEPCCDRDSLQHEAMEAAARHALLCARELFGQDLPPSDPAVLAFRDSLLEALYGVLYPSVPRRRIPPGTTPETFFRSMWNWLQTSLPRLLPETEPNTARLACVAAISLYFPPPGVTTLARVLGTSTNEAMALLKAASAPGPHRAAAEVLADAFESQAWAQAHGTAPSAHSEPFSERRPEYGPRPAGSARGTWPHPPCGR